MHALSNLNSGEVPRAGKNQFYGIAIAIVLHVLIVFAMTLDAIPPAVPILQSVVILKNVEPDKPPPPPPDVLVSEPKVLGLPKVFIPVPDVSIDQPREVQSVVAQSVGVPEPQGSPIIHREIPEGALNIPLNTGENAWSTLIRNGCELLEYPWIEQKARHEGAVMLSLLVTTEGKVAEAVVDRSSGYPNLDEAARLGMAKCKFKPTVVDGVPRLAWKKLNFVWVTLGL